MSHIQALIEARASVTSSPAFLPHVFCYLWNWKLIALHSISDSLIAISYFSIPITLAVFVRKRKDLPFEWMFLAFACFIVFCGITHIMEIWTLWHPNYWVAGVVKAATAVASIITACTLIPLVPKAVALPSPRDLRVALDGLQEKEETVRQLSNRLLALRDEERKSIAHELHETMGQDLSVTKMAAEALLLREGENGPHSSDLHDLIAGLNRSLSQIRSLSYVLHPLLLDEAGVVVALQWYTENLSKRSGMEINLTFSPPSLPRLPEELEIAIFRIVQECLTNVYRHSKSTKAEIHVVQHPDRITISVRDFGRGMPEKSRGNNAKWMGVGVAGMKERAMQLGGELTIRPAHPGTMVQATLPIPITPSSALLVEQESN